MATPICKLCGDQDPFYDLDWKEISEYVFKIVENELNESKPETKPICQAPDTKILHRPIVTGDDTEDEDSDIEEDIEEDEGDEEEAYYYDQVSSTIYTGSHQSKRTKANLLDDIKNLYTINQLLIDRLVKKITSEKYQLVQKIQSRLT